MHANATNRRGRRDLLTVSKTRDLLLTVFALACLALPLGIAAAGNLAGIP